MHEFTSLSFFFGHYQQYLKFDAPLQYIPTWIEVDTSFHISRGKNSHNDI